MQYICHFNKLITVNTYRENEELLFLIFTIFMPTMINLNTILAKIVQILLICMINYKAKCKTTQILLKKVNVIP